jgi:SAM-dependent methyltransferase
VVVAHAEATGCPLWRRYCDRLHERLIRRWAGTREFSCALKTDLFDESVGEGLAGVLASVAERVCGIDVAEAVVELAQRKHPRLQAKCGDVRKLEMADASVDLIVSNSTLDHFHTTAEIRQALSELTRILQPGGLLIVTLDNPRNPIVALRNALPEQWQERSGLVPYFMGQTLAMPELMAALRECGLEPIAHEHLMHVPRVAAMPICRRLGGSATLAERFLPVMLGCERAAALPTAAFTGHFSAALARKPLPR